MYIFERKINYYETDKMGIVHHSNYIRFFEEARCALLEESDLPYDLMEEKGIMSPVLSVSCQYKQHVTFGDIIEIHAYIKEFTGVKFTVGYEIYNKRNNNLCVSGESNHCFTDSNLKPLNIKKHHIDVYEKFINLIEN
jgi:acyl-CoA thioester hydrolase